MQKNVIPSLAITSASITGHPNFTRWFDTVVLPLAIPPVKPNIYILQEIPVDFCNLNFSARDPELVKLSNVLISRPRILYKNSHNDWNRLLYIFVRDDYFYSPVIHYGLAC